MIEVLMECHERELMDMEPLTVLESKCIKALIKKEFVETRIFKTAKGKEIIAFYITGSGKRYLNSL